MRFQDSAFWKWWSVYGKHIEALLIILLLVVVWFSYTQNSELLKEAKEVCPCAFVDKLIEEADKLKDNYDRINQLNNFTIDDVVFHR